MKMKSPTINDVLELAELLRPSWSALSADNARRGVPVCEAAEAPVRDQLKRVEAEITEARTERAVRLRARNEVREKVAKLNVSSAQLAKSPEFKEAEQAVRALGEVDTKLEQLQNAQAGLLRMLGGSTPQRGPNGPANDSYGSDGYAQAARELDLRSGVTRVDVPGASLLRPMAALTVDWGSEGQPAKMAPFTQLGQDRRFLYPVFPRGELDLGDMAISDFRQVGHRKAATIAAANDTVTADDHGYTNGDRVVFVALTGGAGLDVGTTYYVRDAAADTFKVAATAGGAAVDVTSNATAATVIDLDNLGRTVTGEVERDPGATSEKAKLDLGIELATDPVRQFAAIVEKVPVKLFDVVGALEALLRNELQYQHERAIDAHAVGKILAAAPLIGSEGADLIARVRNAVATMHDVGSNPSVLALSPAEAATLDLTQVGADDLYLFLTREAGSASPVWGLRIAEVPGLEAPIVIDPLKLGVFYVATGRVLVDPYTGLSTNEVRVRAEIEGLMHVRDANGAYVIA